MAPTFPGLSLAARLRWGAATGRTRTAMTGTAMAGMSMTGMAMTGTAITGMSMTGTAMMRMAMMGMTMMRMTMMGMRRGILGNTRPGTRMAIRMGSAATSMRRCRSGGPSRSAWG